MGKSVYTKLAISGIKKNKKIYLPYLLCGIGMVMMFCILGSLSASDMIKSYKGCTTLTVVLNLGQFVIGVFAMIFLLYTNSFIIRRRYKEFGLYNILGMDKTGICKIVAIESLITGGISIVAGVVAGTLLSKLAEVGLLNIVHADIDYSLVFSAKSIFLTIGIFVLIFGILMVKSIISVRKNNPLELLKSENKGEKAPKAKWFITLLGVVLLAVAYFLAVSIQSPIKAMILFFVAVILVIISTYLLFISGSVSFCKMLQKNKKYYYKKKHFVSVSSMAYRMKRNGAGLASICILSTMVLVMITSSSSLYFGSEDSFDSLYERDFQLYLGTTDIEKFDLDYMDKYKGVLEESLEKEGMDFSDVLLRKTNVVTLFLEGNKALTADVGDDSLLDYANNMADIFFLSVEDFNALYNTNLSLSGNDAYIYSKNSKYLYDELYFDETEFNIIGNVNDVDGLNYIKSEYGGRAYLLVISDYSILVNHELAMADYGHSMIVSNVLYGFNSSYSKDPDFDMAYLYDDVVSLCEVKGLDYESAFYSNTEAIKVDYYASYGGLFFIGIILSIIFIFAAAMIIYYKQLSEGYEDQAKFDIMQKVGMTKKDIKKSINSQVLTVFFAPLIVAGIHLCFAFPMMWKCLMIFGLINQGFSIMVTAIAFVVFGVFYVLIYKATANSYYKIVSTAE